MARIEFPWYLLEPKRGTYDWSRSDFIVEAAAARGVTLHPIIDWSPTWAAAQPWAAPDPEDFRAYVTAFTKRYEGKFPVIELWNEPDSGNYWVSGEQAYVESVLIPGYQAIKAVNPTIQVQMGGTIGDSGACCSWLEGLYSHGAGQYFDIAAFHNYAGTATVEAVSYQQVLAKHGQGSKPIWLGEFGVQEPGLQDVNQQALLRNVITSKAPIAVAEWYALRDDFAMSCCPATIVKGATWGLVRHDNVKVKDAFFTMQQLVHASSTRGGPPTPTG
jgi:hypothetical protein